MSAHKDHRLAHPRLPKTPISWKRNRVVHEVTHVQETGFSPLTGKMRMTLRTACGIYEAVDEVRAFRSLEERRVNCLDCIAEPGAPVLRNGDTLGFVTKVHADGTVSISTSGLPFQRLK